MIRNSFLVRIAPPCNVLTLVSGKTIPSELQCGPDREKYTRRSISDWDKNRESKIWLARVFSPTPVRARLTASDHHRGNRLFDQSQPSSARELR